jgi:hypothetical protein
MSADDDSTLSDTIIDKLAPTTADGIPLVWSSDNEAHLEGLLFEVGKFYKRKGLFQAFFKNHAAVLSNGKLAVDALESAYIMSRRPRTATASRSLAHQQPSAWPTTTPPRLPSARPSTARK